MPSRLSTVGRAWTPILTGERRDRSVAAVQRIITALLESRDGDPEDPSIGNGSAGLALVFAYAAQDTHIGFPVEELRAHALRHVDRAIDALLVKSLHPSLYSGFTGIAWAAEHIGRMLFGDESEDIAGDLDQVLLSHLEQVPWTGDYDLILGLVGLGVYAIERSGRPTATLLLERVVERLEECAVRTPPGLAWFTRPGLLPAWQRAAFPDGFFNLGTAHGIPGVIALLAQVHARGIATERVAPLVEGGMSWLLAQARAATSSTRFATVIPAGEQPGEEQSSRLAWCYGDLGISACLLSAARSMGRGEWEQRALEIARQAAACPFEASGVKDAGLCHGAIGNAHVFNRLYQASRDPAFLRACETWIDRGLEFQQPGLGIGGFQAWSVRATPVDAAWRALPGFLEGVVGIALGLLAGISTVEPAWDRLLLLAIPPAPGQPGPPAS